MSDEQLEAYLDDLWADRGPEAFRTWRSRMQAVLDGVITGDAVSTIIERCGYLANHELLDWHRAIGHPGVDEPGVGGRWSDVMSKCYDFDDPHTSVYERDVSRRLLLKCANVADDCERRMARHLASNHLDRGDTAATG